MNRVHKPIRLLLPMLALLLISSAASAQQDTPQAPVPQGQNAPQDQNAPQLPDNSGPPPAATGGTGELNPENPPVTGLDVPRSEPAFGGRSYLVPGLQLSESAATNVAGTAGGSGVSAVSQALGSLDLQKLWKRYAVGVDYIGGGDFYSGTTFNGQGHVYQEHTLASDQRLLWRNGELALRNNFDYLPEGTFGFSSIGGSGSFSSALGGTTGVGTGLGGGIAGGTPAGLYGGGAFGSVGFEPRIDDTSVAEVTQELSARSSVTLGGSFSLSHFLDKGNSSFPLINSEQTTLQAGYNRTLNPSNQVGLLYAFQEFHFPQAGSGSLSAQVWNLLYAHRITGKLNFVIGGGPQIVDVSSPAHTVFVQLLPPPFPQIPVNVAASTIRSISGNGTATIHYVFSSRTSAQLLYQRYVSAGSGFLPGSNTNVVRASASHMFRQRWTGLFDGGYSFNSALHNASQTTGLNSNAYRYWYAGGSLRRQLSPHFDVFAAYQFNDFGAYSCQTTATNTGVCGQSARRQTGQIGIDWRPRPIQLN
jgi:hypothetical protein